VTAPSLLDAALAAAFLAGMFAGAVVRWFYAERSR
jgi:hypothetical protein